MHILGGHLHWANVASSIAVGGGNIGPTYELSPNAWSGHSSPHETSDVNTLVPSQHEPHEDDHLQPECSTMVMDDTTAGMDLQSDADASAKPSSDVASVVVAIAPSTITTADVGAVDNTKPCVHNGENKGDGTLEGSKKRKEPAFLEGIELVDLDDCNIPDRRL